MFSVVEVALSQTLIGLHFVLVPWDLVSTAGTAEVGVAVDILGHAALVARAQSAVEADHRYGLLDNAFRRHIPHFNRQAGRTALQCEHALVR